MTELVTEVPYERPFHHVEGADDEMEHDAAVAHALVMAISELEGTYGECAKASDTQLFIRERADELMASWGFGED